ncbi:hypothetical protein, partial [Mesonia sp.]|uniref:hypothetical protein n=1 Tax=Mesonia sp. TaxID=1960830 RepID=UPI0025BF7FD0
MRNIILFFLLLLNNIAFYSQKTTVSNDSLNAKLNLVYTNYDELDYLNAVIQGRQLLEKAYEKNDSVYIAEAYYALGIIDETVQDYNKAEEKYTNALNIAEARRDSVFLVDIYNGLANIASLQKKHKNRYF